MSQCHVRALPRFFTTFVYQGTAYIHLSWYPQRHASGPCVSEKHQFIRHVDQVVVPIQFERRWRSLLFRQRSPYPRHHQAEPHQCDGDWHHSAILCLTMPSLLS